MDAMETRTIFMIQKQGSANCVHLKAVLNAWMIQSVILVPASMDIISQEISVKNVQWGVALTVVLMQINAKKINVRNDFFSLGLFV